MLIDGSSNTQPRVQSSLEFPMKSRRHFLSRCYGMGTIALASLLNDEGLLASPAIVGEPRSFNTRPKAPHSFGKAKAMISMFMQGGPSHIDLFDPKPALKRLDGKDFPGELKYDDAANATREVMDSPWKFSRRGGCGMEISELLPHLATIADDITLIRSMHTGVNNHNQSIYAMTNGTILAGRPTVGSWLIYGLGSESQDLPAYVALTDPRGLPVAGVDNFSNGWLPSIYQGTVIRPKEPRIPNLEPPRSLTGQAQQRYLSFVNRLNQRHSADRPGETDLTARIQSFELAAQMQTEAKDALDISSESETIKKLYGIDNPATAEFGTRCLIARRLVERGVRFVQVLSGDQHWDHHGGIVNALPKTCQKVDKPAAALVMDLKRIGLLETTLVHRGRASERSEDCAAVLW